MSERDDHARNPERRADVRETYRERREVEALPATHELAAEWPDEWPDLGEYPTDPRDVDDETVSEMIVSYVHECARVARNSVPADPTVWRAKIEEMHTVEVRPDGTVRIATNGMASTRPLPGWISKYEDWTVTELVAGLERRNQHKPTPDGGADE